MAFVTERGRLRVDGELPTAPQLTRVFGSVARPFSLLRRVTSVERWDRIRQERRADVLVCLALAPGSASSTRSRRIEPTMREQASSSNVPGDDLRADLHRREARLAPIRAAKARLEAKQRAADDARGRHPGQDRNPKGGPPYNRAYGEPDEKAQSNFTDPESSIMKTSSEGFQQCYNAQAAVDAEHQLLVATDLTANASGHGELSVLLDAVKETFDAQPETVLADAGYCNERDMKDLEQRALTGFWRRAGRANRRLPGI